MLMRQFITLVVFAILGSISTITLADDSKNTRQFGKYVVHFNAVPTDVLTTQTAKQHKVVRSRNRIMLNIVVKQKTTDQKDTPVKAKVIATATNLTGQMKEAVMRPVHDGKAIYYIGEFNVADREYLTFNIEVTPDAQKNTYTLNFKKQFFTR